jgi:hypothetical protein
MSCNTYCIEPLPDFDPNLCEAVIKAGSDKLIFLSCDSTAVTTGVYSTSNIDTDITNGKASVLTSVTASATDASPNAAPSAYKAGQEPKPSSYTQTISIIDKNVSEANDTAWEELDGTTGRTVQAIILTTVEGHSELYESLNGFVGSITKPLADNIDDDIHYAATFTGRMKHKPKMITTPDVYGS